MRACNYLVLFCLLLMQIACDSATERSHTTTPEGSQASSSPVSRDLQQIKEDGTLRALTIYSGTSYFLYRGQTMGYEFELLERFAEFLDVELEIVLSNDIDSLLYDLNEGKADVVAHGLTITSERKEIVAFTDYLFLAHQVLVQKQPDDWRNMKWSAIQRSLLHDAIELIGDTVSVRANSSYVQRLKNLSNEIGGEIVIDSLSGSFATDEIIKMVVDGEIKYTIADDNIASINASYYPILNIEVPVSLSQRAGWAVRRNSPELLDAANDWLSEFKKSADYNVIYNKYYENSREFRRRIQSEFFSLNEDKISEYDELIKRYSRNLGWDWRLVAAIIYQESRFDPNASSWAGAKGLMQLMAPTAKELGVKDRSNPEDNLQGGTTYLRQTWDKFEDILDPMQRIKMTLASYNCGYYHVRDARNLAEKRGLDKYLWDDNVDEMLLALTYPKNYNDPIVNYGFVRGIEPNTYVDQIFGRYSHYTKFIDE